MTIEWKRFDDEVPREPRSVVVGRRHRYGTVAVCLVDAWSYFPESRWWATDNQGAIYIDHTGSDQRWREVAFDSDAHHWAYIDPPEDA